MNNPGSKMLTAEQYQFLSGGGEMGALTRAKDWSKTSLGSPEYWPQSLRTTLSIILNSKFPMFLFWEEDLICFYNDAYRPSLGKDGKHPSILGMKGEKAWTEIWPIIKPLIDQVLAGGEATWSEDQLIPIYRNGKIEDVYWTFSYSPVNDESGKPAGVFVTCTETTEKIKTLYELAKNKNELEFAIEATQLGTWDYNPATNKFSANERLKEWFGLPSDEEVELHHAIDAIAANDRKKVTDAIQKALDSSSAGHYDIEYTIVHPVTKKETNVRAKGKAWFNDEKIAYRFNGTLEDVSEQIIARRKVEQNRETLNIVLAASELATWELNVKTSEVHYSDRYLEILGYKKGTDLTHQQILKHLHPDDLPVREKALKKAFSTGVLHYQSRIIWNDKSIHWIDGRGKVFYDEDGTPLKLMGTLRDITDEKNYQKHLEEREQKFRLLADSMPQHIWTSDTEGNLNYYNQSVFDYSGLTLAQITKDGWLQIVHPDDREENIRQWMNAVTTGKDFLFEHRFRRYDGEYRWQLSRAVPQKDADGKIQMWVGTSTDIQDMKELDQQKDYFISMASHELKTPITSIKGYAQMMQNMYLNSEDVFLKNSLRTIDKQIGKLTHLISGLLDVSKMKSGSLVLTKENFPINKLIREAIEEMKLINPDHNFVFSEETETIVYADRERIGQVLTNLVTNAVKYSPASRSVKVKSAISNDGVTISVEDSGIGITKKDQEKIFERFYRVEGKNERTFPGFGIGLFISAEIAQRHNGKIGVESEPGKGSTFYFFLPFDKHNT